MHRLQAVLNRYRGWLPALGPLLVAAILRALLLWANVVPFNSDEAVVGLMARHILQGERPIFFYGQAYMGSLDAWLVAGAFALLGQSVLVIRLVQTALYLGLIFTTYLLGLKIYRSTWMAGAAALFLALPSVLVTLYTTASLGDYGETLLIGNLLLLLALSMSGALFPWLALGFLGGLGFWTFPLIGVYLLPVVGYLLIRQWVQRRALARRGWPKALLGWGLFVLGFGAGAAPWLWFTFTQGSATLSEMFGAAIAGASSTQPVAAILGHFYNFLLFGLTVIFGMRPPWGAQFLALPLMPFALVIYTALTLFIFQRSFLSRDAARPGRLLLVSCVLALVALFVFTPFGADPSGRYFLPLMPIMSLFLADLLWPRREWLHHPSLPPATGVWLGRGRALALGVLVFNWWGNLQCAVAFPPGITTQFGPNTQVDQRSLPELMAFLGSQGETRGYTNYWVEFPLAFFSHDELLYAARLPYHLDFQYTLRYDRYRPYSQAVEAGSRVAYITTLHLPLDERLRAGFARLGVSFAEKQIGDFHIFYALSRKVIPEELGLGQTTPAP